MRSPRLIVLILLAFASPFLAHATCVRNRAFQESLPVGASALTPSLSRMPVVADFNGDSRPDFAAHDSDYFRKYAAVKESTRATGVGIYLNDSAAGSLKFLPAIQLNVGEASGCFNCVNETDLQAADFNLDGAPDLAVSLSANDAVYVLINKKLPKMDTVEFFPPVKLAVGEDPLWVRVGSFDEDSFPDIATVNLERRLVVADVWSLSYLKGNGDGTFEPANTLVLGDADRLGFTDRNNVSPYERHETDVHVLPFASGADVLVTSGILVLPRVWDVKPGEKGFSALKLPIRLPSTPGLLARTGTAPMAFFDSFELFGPGSLALGKRFRLLDPDWSDAANVQLADYLAHNVGSLGRLEGFHLADFDGDGQRDVFAFFSNAMAVGFRTPPLHPFAPLVGGSGEVQIVRLFQRNGDDTPRFHSAAVADFDGDRILDVLTGSDNPGIPLMIYLGQDIVQAGPVELKQLMPSEVLERGKVLFTGNGFKTPSPLLYATLTEVGAPPMVTPGRWTVPLSSSDILSQTQLALRVPVLGDGGFWRKRPAGKVTVEVTVDNPCERSSPPLQITVLPNP